MLALIQGTVILRVFAEGLPFLELGNSGMTVSPALVGWEGEGFQIVAVTPAVIPDGARAISGPTYALVDGAVVETIETTTDPIVPDSVSARQFRMQLRIAGLLDQVTAWVATQAPLVQDAFAYSGSFVRSEPMMASGFTALGYSSVQIDAFFVAAAAL